MVACIGARNLPLCLPRLSVGLYDGLSVGVQSRFAETRFAETRFAEMLTLTLTLNPNFGESGFGTPSVG